MVNYDKEIEATKRGIAKIENRVKYLKRHLLYLQELKEKGLKKHEAKCDICGSIGKTKSFNRKNLGEKRLKGWKWKHEKLSKLDDFKWDHKVRICLDCCMEMEI